MKSLKNIFTFLPFWFFLTLFKFGGDIHFNSMSPLGEKIFPIWIVGLLIGGASLFQLIFDVPAGFILDKYGYKRFLKITTLFFILAVSFLFFGLNKYTYILTLLFSVFGWLFYGPGVNAYVLSQAPQKDTGRFISFRDTFDSIGVLLGGWAFAFLIDMPVPIIALAALIVLVCAYISISLAPDSVPLNHLEKKIETQHYYVRRQYLHKVLKAITKLNPASTMLLLTALSSSTFYAIIWFVVPLFISHNQNSGAMTWGLSIFDLAIIFTGFWLGRLADKMNKRILVFFGLLIFSVMAMMLGFHFGILFLILGFLATVGDEISSLSLWLWLYTLDKKHAEDGLVSGVVSLFHDLGWTIGPIVAGFLYSGLGSAWTIAIGGFFVLIIWIVYSVSLSKSHSHVTLNFDAVPKKPHRFRHKG